VRFKRVGCGRRTSDVIGDMLRRWRSRAAGLVIARFDVGWMVWLTLKQGELFDRYPMRGR